jgi:penicillin-binding protein 1B
LLCVVWIGYDDNRDLGLSGSQTAAPIWAEFMKRAVALPAYKNTQDFEPPPGVIQEAIDPQSGELATSTCPQTAQEYFIAGSEPTQLCELHGGHNAQSVPGSWLSHLFGKGSSPPPPPAPNSSSSASNNPNAPGKAHAKNAPGTSPAQPAPVEDPEKKKGFLDKIFGIFGSSKKPADSSKPQP